MHRFFINKNDIAENTVKIQGENFRHLCYVLRAKKGEEVLLCDGEGNEYHCLLSDFDKDYALAVIQDITRSSSEPTVKLVLFQCLPKGDKMETIIEKSVELGVHQVVPVLSSRCVSRPDNKSLEKKRARWQAICASAAKQSGRGIIPEVCTIMDYETALKEMLQCDRSVMFYEQCDSKGLENAIEGASSVAVLIGPEGGFSEGEANAARQAGVRLLSLGKRILRCETAPVSAISVIMHITGNL